MAGNRWFGHRGIDHLAVGIERDGPLAVLAPQLGFKRLLNTAFSDDIVHRIAFVFQFGIFFRVNRADLSHQVRRDISRHIFPDGAFHHHNAGKLIGALLDLDDGGNRHIRRQRIRRCNGKTLPLHLVADTSQLPLLQRSIFLQMIPLHQPAHHIIHASVRPDVQKILQLGNL